MGFKNIDKDYPLILASASPRRKRLLEQVGLPFVQIHSGVDENLSPSGHGPWKEMNAGELVKALALEKALAVHAGSEDGWVLGADTMVVLGDRIIGKPGDEDEAQAMLRLLSGQEHAVVTGFAVLFPSGRTAHAESVTTLVRIKPLSSPEIEAYVKTGEPFGKAGGYAVQGVGAFMVESISGPYTNVVGLPLCALIKALLKVKALENFPVPGM